MLKKKTKSLGHQFFATRYVILEVAMLEDWQNNTCVGNYLKKYIKKEYQKMELKEPEV